MIQWKQRLYAFLLRRLLGPFLDETATKKLHDSIDISLHEGKFVLTEISLNSNYLTGLLASSAPDLCLKEARVDRLEINLALRENDHTITDPDSAAPQSSLAWRAMKLGTSDSTIPAVSLIADIEISGVYLEFKPNTVKTRQRPPPQPVQETDPDSESSRSIIGSYLDAALASLKVTPRVNNLNLKFCVDDPTKQSETWLQIRLASASYRDVDATAKLANNSNSSSKNMLNKVLEFTGLSVQVGESGTIGSKDGEACREALMQNRTSTVALAQGTTQVCLRLVEYESASKAQSTTGSDTEFKPQFQHDIEVRLAQQLNLSADKASIVQILTVAKGLSGGPKEEQSEAPILEKAIQKEDRRTRDDTEDQEDLRVLTGIMKQYQEAYHLAERNELRGGILIPSNAYEEGETVEDDEAMTFDVFFDANDQSFHNYTSMLRESILKSGTVEGLSDFVHMKMRVQLMSGCFKLILSDPKRHLYSRRPEEYLLLSFDDLNVSSSLASNKSEHSISISHLEIDDAQFVATKSDDGYVTMGGTVMPEGRVEIGSLLRFISGPSDGDELLDDAIVSQAPCISLSIASKTEDTSNKAVECDFSLEPVELVYRHSTLSNLSYFLKDIGEGAHRSESEIAGNCNAETNENQCIHLSGSCPAITFSVPVLREVNTQSLFNRCGEVLDNVSMRQSALGIRFENISIIYDDGQQTEESATKLDSAANVSCDHFLLFASSPLGNGLAVGSKMRRIDIAAGKGRLEVEPCIPISIDFKSSRSDTQGANHGRNSFPVVPLISSFKARQEDEDEDQNIDRVLFSKLQSVDADSRKELRGCDPQSSMLSNAENCRYVVVTCIPEIVVDVSTNEMDTILQMLEASVPTPPSRSNYTEISDTQGISKQFCVALNCGHISLLLHGDVKPTEEEARTSEQYTYMLMMDQFKSHTVLIGSEMEHFRLLCHEPTFYEVCKHSSTKPTRQASKTVQRRLSFLRERGYLGSILSVSPLFYRSHMFTPISRETPTFLLDLTDLASTKSGRGGFAQKKVHLTVYHLTYRYDADSKWMERITKMMDGLNHKSPRSEAVEEVPLQTINGQSDTNVNPSLTRMFVSLADCNLDYMSAPYFKEASRSIVRIGDLRISSNIMRPAGLVQGYSISLGDVSLHLCNRRLPYGPENSKLCGASRVMGLTNTSALQPEQRFSMYTPEALLREMSFVNVLTLDSMDAVVAVSNKANGRGQGSNQDPRVTASLTLGLLSVHACKDSIALFASTVGELQAKLTALSNDDIMALRREQNQVVTLASGKASAPKAEVRVERRTGSQRSKDSGDQSVDGGLLGPLVDMESLRTRKGQNQPFLLDGYDWTTVDQDPNPEPDIPDDDEQVALWYPDTRSSAETDSNRQDFYPGQIIHQHFPLHTVSDPLAEGDMGAKNFAGSNADPQVKSRILVHDLTIKLRFFDGYDWPESLSLAKRKAKRTESSFIIEPIPEAAIQEGKTEKRDGHDTVDTKQQRREKLMGNLLDTSQMNSATFDNMPLPEERVVLIQRQADWQRLSRKTQTFFQISANGVTLRVDSFAESRAHKLASIMDLSISDLFLAESVSRSSPLKMFGEWVNDKEHPRDTRHGMLMFKMVTWHPSERITSENELANDECEVTMQLLSTRCVIDQRAISFARAFFASDEHERKGEGLDWTSGLHLVPPPKFRVFRVKPWKLKVDYCPKKLDIAALREGSFVELINLSPLDGMVITLKQVTVEDVIGMGDVFGGLVGSWVQEVASTQLHKFITNARPFEPFANVSSGVSDMVVLPYEAFKNGEDVRRAMRSGITSLAGTVAFEALTTTSKLTQYAANKMAKAVGGTHVQRSSAVANPLPSRPLETPKGVSDVTGHALESLTRGIQAANYKVLVVPYRELKRSGTTGAAKSVLKGIPVLVVAPLTGATEAISYTLLGARNALRPDIRKEEEASLLHYDV